MAVLRMVERVVSEGDSRGGVAGGDLGPEDARALLRAWLRSVELDDVREHELLEILQAEDFHHAALGRRARRCHERALRHAVAGAVGRAGDGVASLPAAAAAVFEACVPAIPYAPASAFLGREKARLVPREGEPRVALVADGLGGVHGVTRTIDELRARGVPGWDVEVIGTDAGVDRRLSAVTEVEVPSYPGLVIGVPSLPAVVDALAEGRYDVVHVDGARPGRGDGRGARADHGRAGRRELPHRALRLRRHAHRRPTRRGGRRDGARGLLRRRRPRAVAEPVGGRDAARPRGRRRPHRPLGPRRRHRSLRRRTTAWRACCPASAPSSTRGG